SEAVPGIADDGGGGTSRFKDSGGRGEPDFGHGIAIQVQDQPCGGIKGIVIPWSYKAASTHIAGQGGVLPALACQQKLPIGTACSRTEEEMLHPQFAIGKAMREKRHIRAPFRPGRGWIMGVGIKAVVNRVAAPCTESAIPLHNWRATAVCEYEIVRGQQATEALLRIGIDGSQGCGGVHIPKGDLRAAFARRRGCSFQHRSFQILILRPNPAVLMIKSAERARSSSASSSDRFR